MTEQKTFAPYILRSICIENEWFTDGSIEQYDKFFTLMNTEQRLRSWRLLFGCAPILLWTQEAAFFAYWKKIIRNIVRIRR